jgi:hypothetical protein
VFQGQDEAVLTDVEDAKFSLVYTSPESMLGSKRWERNVEMQIICGKLRLYGY